MSKLKPYILFCLDPSEGACLAFAHTARQAKKIGWRSALEFGGDYQDVRVQLFKNAPWLYTEADPKKLEAGEPHVIFAPKSCERCEVWGKEMSTTTDLCVDCEDAQEEDKE